MQLYEMWWQFLLLALGAYFIGNINSSVLITRKKVDVRKLGSGNPGTMNMLRNYGGALGALTLVLDIIKGVIPTLTGYLIFRNFAVDGFNVGDLALFIAGFSVVIGHIYPIVFKFKGGKGVATTFGVFFVAQPLVMFIALVLCIAYICVFEYGSVGSFIGIATPAAVCGVQLNTRYFVDGAYTVPIGGLVLTFVLILAIVFITFFAHRKNIQKLVLGKEHKTKLAGIIVRIFKKKAKT